MLPDDHRQSRPGKSTPSEPGEPKKHKYVIVHNSFTGDPSYTDAEKVAMIALESWAWGRDHCWPGNSEGARRCGWFGPDGKPSAGKFRRVLAGLEAKGAIRRELPVVNRETRRDRITILCVRPSRTDPLALAEGTKDSGDAYLKIAVPPLQNGSTGTPAWLLPS